MISPVKMLANWLRKSIAEAVVVDAYVGNRETSVVIVDVSIGNQVIERVKIHPKMGTYDNMCGMASCDGIHKQLR